jgi:hypothetical protein
MQVLANVKRFQQIFLLTFLLHHILYDFSTEERKMEWLDENEVSKITGYTPKTLRTLRSTGEGPRYARVGKIRYSRQDVDDFMSKRREAQDAEMESRRKKACDGDFF